MLKEFALSNVVADNQFHCTQITLYSTQKFHSHPVLPELIIKNTLIQHNIRWRDNTVPICTKLSVPIREFLLRGTNHIALSCQPQQNVFENFGKAFIVVEYKKLWFCNCRSSLSHLPYHWPPQTNAATKNSAPSPVLASPRNTSSTPASSPPNTCTDNSSASIAIWATSPRTPSTWRTPRVTGRASSSWI